MKILIIPDVHGSHEWEAAKKLPVTAYDYAVFLGDFVVLSEKDININRKNNLIVADSNSHHIFDVIDTENLLGNEMSLLEFSKFYKRTHKQINDIKSQEFAQMNYSKETVMTKLIEAFGEKLADRYYRMFFE